MKILIAVMAYFTILCRKLLYSNMANRVRVEKYRILGVSIGRNCRIRPGVLIKGCKNVRIGSDVYLGECSRITAYGANIDIQDNVLIAENVYISSRNHRFKDVSLSIAEQGYSSKNVIVSENVWLAYGSVITAGSHVPSGSVVAANTVFSRKENNSQAMLHRQVVSTSIIGD
jgi:acetyltransferase-like isoleucine patch superfamily enzyme